MQTTTRLEVHPVAGALGAELPGVDLGADLDDATITEIRQALLDHCVIFFRDQAFDAEQHKRLARRFGEIFVHPNYAGIQADPEIVMIRREPGDTRVVGEDWHTDTTMMAKPPGALRQLLLHGGHRGPHRRGEPATAGFPDGARPPPRVHLPVPLDQGRGRLLGQPLRQASGDQRRRALPATDAESADRVSPPASRRHLSMIRGFHLADFLTLGNAACGVLAIFAVMAYLELRDVRRLLAATALIPVALALDVLDGRVARSRHMHSALGR